MDVKVPFCLIVTLEIWLSNAVKVKNSGPFLFIGRIEWIFSFTECIVFGDQSSSSLLVPCSCMQFVFLFGPQQLAKWPIVLLSVPCFHLAWHSCCRDQFELLRLLQSVFLNFAGLFVRSLVILVYLLSRYQTFVSSSVSSESFSFSYIHAMLRLLPLPTYRIF